MPTCSSESKCFKASKSWVKGDCTNAAVPKSISPIFSPFLFSKKSFSTPFTASRRSIFLPSVPLKSCVDIEPDKSTATSISRCEISFTIGSPINCGFANAKITSVHTIKSIIFCKSVARDTPLLCS